MNRLLTMISIAALMVFGACGDDTAAGDGAGGGETDAGTDRGSSDNRDTGGGGTDTGGGGTDTGGGGQDTGGNQDTGGTIDTGGNEDTGGTVDTGEEDTTVAPDFGGSVDAGSVPDGGGSLFPDVDITPPDAGSSDDASDIGSGDASDGGSADAGDVDPGTTPDGTCAMPFVLNDEPIGDAGDTWMIPTLFDLEGDDEIDTECAADDANGTTAEDVFMFTPPEAGVYFFVAADFPPFPEFAGDPAVEAEVDTIISVWTGCGTDELECNDDVYPVVSEGSGVSDSIVYVEVENVDPIYIGVEPYDSDSHGGAYLVVAGKAASAAAEATCGVNRFDGTDATAIASPVAAEGCDWDADVVCVDGEGDDDVDADVCEARPTPVITSVTHTVTEDYTVGEDDENCPFFDSGDTVDYVALTVTGTGKSPLLALWFSPQNVDDSADLVPVPDSGDPDSEGDFTFTTNVCMDPAITDAVLADTVDIAVLDISGVDGWHPDTFFFIIPEEDEEGNVIDATVFPTGFWSEDFEYDLSGE